MMSSFSRIKNQIKTYLVSREMVGLLVPLGGALLIVIVAFFYLPLVPILITAVLFGGVASITVKNQLRLITLQVSEATQKNQIKALIENVREGVIIYDTNLKVLKINKSAEEIFQISATEVVNTFVNPGLAKQPHLRAFVEIMFPSLAPAVTQISEAGKWPQVVNVSLDNPKLDLSTTLYQVMDERGRLTGFLKLVKDLTRENVLLETKSEFLSVAAHQLRTPLTAIHWSLENLAKLTENATPEIKELVQQTFQTSDRALKITNDLLDASKIEEGRFGYNFEETDIYGFLKKLMEDVTPVAKQYGIRMYFESRGAQPLVVQLDPLRMHTAISNLLDNAIRYNTKNGEVFVSVAPTQDNSAVTITVRDTGVGIPEESQRKLFQKFQRGQNAVAIEPNGSGLGLFITKNIIESHGGAITFESVANRGTTFSVTLPIKQRKTKETTSYGGAQSLETN